MHTQPHRILTERLQSHFKVMNANSLIKVNEKEKS